MVKNQTQRPTAFDRGATPYFHGRTHILDDFEGILDSASNENDGSIFLVQGAPGVGKTALLDQCKKKAESRDWKIANIYSSALWNPDDLLYYLGKNKGAITGVSGEIGVGVDNLGHTNLGIEITRATRTLMDILENGRKPLLLILDEAQSLGIKDVIPSEMKGVVNNILTKIHNGQARKPIVLLAGGLGTTLKSFASMGVSRFSEDFVVHLSGLSQESERAVIHDWIVKDAKAKGDPSAWIDAIAAETQGWPRHVHSYARHAANYLKENERVMNHDGLNLVLMLGRTGRVQYYKQRFNDFYIDEIRHLTSAISDYPVGRDFDRLDVISHLAKNYGKSKSETLFDQFLDSA